MSRFFPRCIIVAFVLFVDASTLFAQAPSFIPPSGFLSGPAGTCNFVTGKLSFDCIPLYIGFLIKLLLGFAAGFFLIGVLLGGYRYVMGSVTAEGKEAGKKELIATVAGFSVMILSYLLVDTVIEALT